MIAPTIVLIPGNMCDASMWDGIVPELENAGWQICHADTTRDTTISAMAARASYNCPGPLLPVGFSMGGIIALEMARQAPERLAGLVLLDANPGADLPERAAARPGHQQRVRDGELETIVRDELMPVYLADENRDCEDLKERIVSMALRLGEKVFVQQSEALRTRRDNWELLSGFDKPAFIACGEHDVLCPPAWHQKMASELPQAELHIIKRAAHMLPLERPDVLAMHLASWLEACINGGEHE